MVRVARYASPIEGTLYGETLLDRRLATSMPRPPTPTPLAAPLRQLASPSSAKASSSARSVPTPRSPKYLAATREVLKAKAARPALADRAVVHPTPLKGRRRSSAWYRGSETGTWCRPSALKGLDALLKALRGVKWRRGSRASRRPSDAPLPAVCRMSH